ncbi:MAG: 2-amino-4-hydroxy-6-hydroxymethyldihydropteridine diphosphokinase [Candidatus Omnitrophota bacterium]
MNGVVEIGTNILPEDLLVSVKEIERSMGRVPSEEKNSPRIIDIDILLYDDIILNSVKLTIPHPRMHERNFVLKGFSEIAPDMMHPVVGKTMKALYNRSKM